MEPRHVVTLERVRGFQPPWHSVLVYRCADGTETRLRVSWHGPAPRGAIVGNCGHLLVTGGAS